MSTFDDLIAEGEASGVDAEFLERVKAATAASPLRAENEALKAQRAADAAELAALRNATLETNFKAAGINISPSVLNLPSDLDIRNVAAIRDYAASVGLVQKEETPPTPEPVKAAMKAMSTPPGEAEVADAQLDLSNIKDLRALNAQLISGGWSNTQRGRSWN